MIKLEVLAIAVVIALAAGAGSGWTVNGWRLGGTIEGLEGAVATQKQSLATLEGANTRCTAGLAGVRDAVKAFADDGAKRSAAAAAAMAKVEQAAAAQLAAAKAALQRAMPPPGGECDAAAREASAYARKRQGAP
jgi:hypothetical protein